MRKRCKSCEADILWFTTNNGKPIPVDAEPDKRVVIGRNGKAYIVDTYVPHHATCPYADDYRKKS